MRHTHILQRNRNVEMPSYLIFVDTETKPKQIGKKEKSSKLWIGECAYVYKGKNKLYTTPTYFSFYDSTEFWDIVVSKIRAKTKLYVFAHNWSFDYPVLRTSEWMYKNGWQQGKAVIEGPPTFISFRKNNATIVIIDNLNYFRGSLASIGKSLGIDKLPMPKYTDPIEDWYTY